MLFGYVKVFISVLKFREVLMKVFTFVSMRLSSVFCGEWC